MNTSSSVDRETFQQLLANAFAVQESQINRQSLSAIMEVQRSVVTGKLDLDGAMRHIVESARNVANAAGVAIGLLKGDQLTYRAGSGTSAAYIGRQVTASLTVSADTTTSREILRVEDAQTDTRIEADICRQFEANSLLILPIYHDRALAGVLEVLFREAHAFQDREVRTYRLMAQQIESALFHAAQPEQKKNLVAELPTLPDAFAQIAPQSEESVSPPEFWMGESSEPSIYERCETALAAARELPAFKKSVFLVTMITQRARDLTRPSRWRNLALAAVAVVLGFTAWIAYVRRGPTSSLQFSRLPRSTAIDQQAAFPKPLPGKDTSTVKPAPVLAKEARRARPAFKRVRVGPNEVDYIGEDVTVRLFSDKPAAKRSRPPESRIAHIGNDVTVRYFTPPQPAAKSAGR